MSSNLWECLHLFLSFVLSAPLKSAGQVCCRTFPLFSLIWCVLIFAMRWWIGGSILSRWGPASLHHNWRYMMWIELRSHDINFDHFVNIGLVRILDCKVTVISFHTLFIRNESLNPAKGRRGNLHLLETERWNNWWPSVRTTAAMNMHFREILWSCATMLLQPKASHPGTFALLSSPFIPHIVSIFNVWNSSVRKTCPFLLHLFTY